MTGRTLTLVADCHATIGGLDFNGLLYQVVQHRVIMLDASRAPVTGQSGATAGQPVRLMQ